MNLNLAVIGNEIRTVAETLLGHAGTLAAEAEAEARRAQASPVVQALEAAVLTPAEEAMVTDIIARLPSLRAPAAPDSAESPAEPLEPAGVPEVPADVPGPVPDGPVVGGAAA